jgi:hypothetical protein
MYTGRCPSAPTSRPRAHARGHPPRYEAGADGKGSFWHHEATSEAAVGARSVCTQIGADAGEQSEANAENWQDRG